VDFALIFQSLQLPRGVPLENVLHMLGLQLAQAGVQAEAALFEGAHLLKAEGHVVHGALDEKPVARVALEHQPI